MNIETMKLTDPHDHPEPHTMKWTRLEMDYINKRVEAAVRAAIEQAEKQEPVATIVSMTCDCGNRLELSSPNHTAPPQREWVGLTDEEHTQIAIACGCATADWVFYGAAVERKLKEKNDC